MKPILVPSLLLLLAASSCRKDTVQPPAPTLPAQAAQPVPDQPQSVPPVVQAVAPPPPSPPPIREVFPGVRLDLAARAVEFDGTIAQGGGEGMVTYLEVLVCRPNSREHESIVMSDVLPSHVHASLLLAGALPGKPGSWTYDKATGNLTPHPPAGDALEITVAWGEPEARTVRPIAELVKNAKNRSTLASHTPGFVFAGSALLQRKVERRYAADVSGTIIGLCTFGDEPIAWAEIISHEEAVDEPAWVVDPATPAKGTKVVVRVQLPEATAPSTAPSTGR